MPRGVASSATSKVSAMNDKGGIAHFEVPAELRTMTETSIEQARVAFNTFMSAAQQAVSRFEGQTKAVQASAKDVSETAS